MLALALALNLTPPLSHLALSRRPLDRELQIATAFLSAQAGVSRVWLFGSAAKGRRPDWRSDLDFAVEGLPASALPGAWSELEPKPCGFLHLVARTTQPHRRHLSVARLGC